MIESPAASLPHRLARGAFWVFALRMADRGLSLARTIILARLLAPADFGVMGIALLVLSTLETLSVTGFDSALVQRKGDIRAHLDSAWTAHVIRGVVIAAAIFFGAPFVAGFFDEPRVVLVLQVLSLSELIKGCQNIGVVYFQKELTFHKEFAYRFTNTLVKLAVSVPAAFMLGDALALVIGVVAADLVSCAASYMLHPYRPRLNAEWSKLKDLFGFGKWIAGTSVLSFFCNHTTDIVIGKVLGAATLGLYQMASMISNLPATEITQVVSRVSFPAYAKLQHDAARLRALHLAILRVVASVTIPLSAGIFLLSPLFTEIVLGPRWLEMVPAMQLLVIWGLLRSIGAPLGALLQGSGRPHVGTKVQLIKLLLLGSVIYPLTSTWGITGAALAVVVHTIPIELYVHAYAIRLLNCPTGVYLKTLVVPFAATLVMYAVLVTLKNNALPSTTVFAFLALVASGVIAYAAAIAALDVVFGYGLREIATRIVKPRPTATVPDVA